MPESPDDIPEIETGFIKAKPKNGGGYSWWWFKRTDQKLDQLLQRTEDIMSSIGDLDAALTTLGEHVAALRAAVEALIAAIPPGDFAAEIASVIGELADVDATAREVAGASPPPPPPTP